MFRSHPLLVCLLGSVAACGGPTTPTDSVVGEGRIVAQVGPGGRVLRGAGGSRLAGFVLDIPPGAVDRLIEVTVEPGPEIEAPGTRGASVPFRILARPDPGTLWKPAALTARLDMPVYRSASDLVLLGTPPEGRPSASNSTEPRRTVVTEVGSFDEQLQTWRVNVATLCDVQVRLTDAPRQPDDSIRLVARGYDALNRLTDTSLLEADQLFAEAQRADPYSPAANLFRALSRVLVVLNDRTDDGLGVDSVGEALTAFGLDVRSRSLLTRFRTADWPADLVVPPNAPSATEVVAMMQRHVRPAIELALRDVDAVSLTVEILLRLPEWTGLPPDERELDATEVRAFRAALGALLLAIDVAEDLDLEADWAFVTSPLGRGSTVSELLARFPSFGSLRELPAERTIAAAQAAMFELADAFALLAAEEDDQSDDLIVFPADTTPEQRELWRGNLRGLLAAVSSELVVDLLLADGVSTLSVEILAPWRGGSLDPRRYFPAFRGFLPVARTLPDPSFGGFLPRTTQDRAADLLDLTNVHVPPADTIVVDGAFEDWSAAAEALLPPDQAGDVPGGDLRALDVTRFWFAESGDDLAFRLTVADGPIGWRSTQDVLYGWSALSMDARGFGTRIDIEVIPTATSWEVRVLRDGVVRPVRFHAAASGNELEVAINRFDLLDPDDPLEDRALRPFAHAIGLTGSGTATDSTRRVVVRF